MRARSFEVNPHPLPGQRAGQRLQRINQRLAARNHDGLRPAGGHAPDDLPDPDGRKERRIPGILGVAPLAPNVAPAQADEISRPPCMAPLALHGIEILGDGQRTPAVEHAAIGKRRHYSVTT